VLECRHRSSSWRAFPRPRGLSGLADDFGRREMLFRVRGLGQH
jgi:hypothetical protein